MKCVAAIFAAVLSGLLFFSTAFAEQEPILPACGGAEQPACTICNLFQLIDNLVRIVIVRLVPAAAGLVIAVAGFKFLVNQDNADVMEESKKIIFMVIIGLLLIYGSYAIVGAIFSGMGYYDSMNPLEFNNLSCD